jgi:omega-6 fatty acid desaturase (delta-12 desaturase)
MRAGFDANRSLTTNHELRSFNARGLLGAYVRFLRALCKVNPALAIQLATPLFFHPRRKRYSYVGDLPTGYEAIGVYHNLKKLTAYRWGKGDRTILLVHGWEANIGAMITLIRPLLLADYSVIALDGPGHGNSPQQATHMVDFGDAVMQTIAQHGPIYGIVANSYGAAATALMLNREPQIHVDKLFLVSPMNHIQQHIDIFEKLLGFPSYMQTDLLDAIQRRLPLPLEQCDVVAAMKHLTIPTMIVHDEHDFIIPFATSKAIAAACRNSILKKTQRLGHRRVLRSELVQQWMLEFLQAPICSCNAYSNDTHPIHIRRF